MTHRFGNGLLLGSVLIALGMTPAHAQRESTRSGANPEETAKPNDAVTELLRAEVDAFRKEQAARFARLRRIGNEGAPDRAIEAARALALVDQTNALKLRHAFPENGANRQALLKNWLVHMRPMLKVEYQFMRTVCEPTRDERIPIAHAGELALREAVVLYVDRQLNQNVHSQARPPAINYRKVIQDGLLAAVKANLSDDVYRRYLRELADRAEEQKQGAVMRLVAKMDRTLLLTDDQRTKIAEVLLRQWEDHLAHNVAYANLEYAYFPVMPEQDILPILSDAQKHTWQETQKVAFTNPFQTFEQAPGPLDDEFPDEVFEIPAASRWLPIDGGKPVVHLLDELKQTGAIR